MFKYVSISIVLISLIILAILWYKLTQSIDSKIKNDIQRGEHVVLLFSAEWCGSCVKMKPIYKKVKQEFPKIKFYLVGSGLNKVEQKLLFRYYKIKGLPTFVIFKNNKEITHLSGGKTEQELREVFSQ